MTGRAHGNLPIRGGRGGGDRSAPRGGGDRGGPRGRGGERGSGAGHQSRGPSGERGGRGGRGGYEGPVKMLTDPIEPPNRNVHNFEDRYVAETAKLRPEPEGLARRPGYGTSGRAIVVRTNFLPLDFKPGVKFHSYRLKLDPENAKRGQQRFIMETMLRRYSGFNNIGVATDGATEIVTTELLPEMKHPFTCTMEDGNGNGKDSGRKSHAYIGPWKVTLKHESSYSPEQMITTLRDSGHRKELDNEAPCLRVLNILMSAYGFKDPGINIIGKGRNKFFRMDRRKQSIDMRGGVEAVRGYYSSVRLGAGRIMLNLNVSHGAFYRPGRMSNLAQEFVELFDQDRELLHRYVKGLKVYATHLQQRENGAGIMEYPVKSILGLATPRDGRSQKTDQKPDQKPDPKFAHPPQVPRVGSCADNVKFWMERDGKAGYISVADYFKRDYNIKLKHANDMPVVNVGTRERPVYLPMELLEIIRGQGFGGEPSSTQRQNMIKFSCRRPPQNYESIITEGLDIMGITSGDTKAVGIRSGQEMITVHARILNPPNLTYAGKKNTPKFGAWNLIQTKFSHCATIKTWTCLWVRKRGAREWFSQPDAKIDAFYKKLRDHGLTLPPPQKPFRQVTLGSTADGGDQKNRELLANAFEELKSAYSLVVVLLPNTDGKNFDYIKYLGDIKHGVLTHCMQAEKFKDDRVSEQYLSNNAMKVNLKMGGCNQLLDSSGARFIGAGKTTMVVGLDVTHPSSTDPEAFPSVAAIVASVDHRMGQWPGEIRSQTRRQEHVEYLTEMMCGRLRLWQKHNNGQLPQNILIYRDGVSEGQFTMVRAEELPKVRNAAKATYRGTMPNITIVVCGKRHNVRFYPTTAKDQDRTANPINGCVVDRGVTRPIFWDFYLQAQAPLQGSARPAHYIVIHDEIFTNSKANPDRKPADILQEITHNICYMMGRATRSISYSTPAFLADKFCDRARKYLLAYYHENMATILSTNTMPDNVVTMADACHNSMVYI
ncbi:hypothetical protein N7457_007363 [Penicillium paradoxum]|uniref:uncharacterized protein n=1 Tax=Penicillium paradoxum TaxID=176176 RepID=UPI002547DBB1|nr:uncharacterized protein N7457_007363 [Penicillium paradoxum]KAJ5779643.1 hypothetical protein N7457_007363 [Penicillium paradoxum]